MKFTITRTSKSTGEFDKHKPLLCANRWDLKVETLEVQNTWGKKAEQFNTVEISTLEELLELAKQEGSLIIGVPPDPDCYGTGIPGIEIYDDYRE